MMTDNFNVVDKRLLWEKLQFDESEIHCLNKKRAIVVFSGGFDSTIALWWALLHYSDIRLIVVDYNQVHKEELVQAKRIASLAGLDLTMIKLDIPLDFWGINNNLTRGQAGLMTSIAALDIGTDGADIVHGILRTDTYPDCDRNYLDNLAGILPNSRDVGKIGIATPLRAVKDKQAVCILGFLYGAPMKWTWSCRMPIEGKPCGSCSPCHSRNDIWNRMPEAYGVSRKVIDSWQDVLGSPMHPSFQEPSHELSVLIQAFVEVGGLNSSKAGWRYVGPDGKERIASWIKNPDAIELIGRGRGKLCKHVEIHGELEKGLWWQIVVCEDNTVAITDQLPDISVVEQAFKEKVITATFGNR